MVGNTAVLDSLAMLKRGGHACLVGFLGGGGPLSRDDLVFAEGEDAHQAGPCGALGQAAVNIANHAGVRVIATTRNSSRAAMLEALGAKEVFLESRELAKRMHA
jgi:NADPH:quinone reductase-like Zn-dependent oxidoreductase